MNICEICKMEIENENDMAKTNSNKGSFEYHYDCYMEMILDSMDNNLITNEGE